MKTLLVLLTASALTACASQPVAVSVDTLCTVTTRFHISDAQYAAFEKDQATWESLVNWLSSFNKVRDKRCLNPSPF